MKKLIFYFILFPFFSYSQNQISQAIIESNPELVKQEISKRISAHEPITLVEQQYYIELCQEVITRRRNALQFPEYQTTPLYCNGMITYYSQPVYKKAFITDEEPGISFNCGLRFTLGTLGTIAALFYWHNSITNYKRTYSKTTSNAIIASGVISFIALLSAIIETDAKRKQHQEELYENAIKIKYLFYNLEIA